MCSAMHIAGQRKNLSIFLRLLEAGGDMMLPNCYNLSALQELQRSMPKLFPLTQDKQHIVSCQLTSNTNCIDIYWRDDSILLKKLLCAPVWYTVENVLTLSSHILYLVQVMNQGVLSQASNLRRQSRSSSIHSLREDRRRQQFDRHHLGAELVNDFTRSFYVIIFKFLYLL